jgi:flagellar motility protein MotE (MotC chaperone)
MKSGYDQFFKKAQKAVDDNGPSFSQRPKIKGVSLADFEKRLSEEAQRPAKKSVGNQELAIRLRERAKQRLKVRRKKRAFPVKAVAFSLIGLIVAGLGFSKVDQIEKFVQGIEVSAIGQAYAADDAKPAAPADATAAKTDDPAKAAAATESPKAVTYTQDDLDHFAKLNERKKELDAREAELNRVEAEMQKQKEALDQRLDELEKTRRGISSVLDDKVQVDDKKVDNLVQMYSNMKPEQAAKAFEEMDEDLAIEILGRMKKKSAAEIMNLVKPEKVKVFSEKYAGYKSASNGN